VGDVRPTELLVTGGCSRSTFSNVQQNEARIQYQGRDSALPQDPSATRAATVTVAPTGKVLLRNGVMSSPPPPERKALKSRYAFALVWSQGLDRCVCGSETDLTLTKW
jgi:hypothetical protein